MEDGRTKKNIEKALDFRNWLGLDKHLPKNLQYDPNLKSAWEEKTNQYYNSDDVVI